MRKFIDQNEPDKIVTEAELKIEYGKNIADQSIDPSEQTFADYISNCLESAGGTLQEIPDTGRSFQIRVEETVYGTITVVAATLKEAMEKADEQYHCYGMNAVYVEGVEDDSFFRCEKCGEAHTDSDKFVLYNDGQSMKYLCLNCIIRMINANEVRTCPHCGAAFPTRIGSEHNWRCFTCGKHF